MGKNRYGGHVKKRNRILMSRNWYDTLFFSRAVKELWEQISQYPEYRHLEPYYRNKYMLSAYCVLPDGKLTVKKPDTGEIDERIEPVDCYNLIEPGESLANAVRRLAPVLE